jgi:CO/xanthine dehydrogenase Mo-binding subunit
MRFHVVADESERRGGTRACGVSAAIANSIHNATGARIREYPLTLDKLLGHLPGVHP